MLEKKMKRKIYGRLCAVIEGMRSDIGITCERLGIIEAVRLLYYYQNEQDLNSCEDLLEEEEE